MGSKSWYKRGTGNKAKICFASYHPVHLCFIIFLNNRNKINLLNTWTGQIGFVYICIPTYIMANSNRQNKVKEINMKRWILFLIVSVFLIGCAKTKIVDDIDLVQVRHMIPKQKVS